MFPIPAEYSPVPRARARYGFRLGLFAVLFLALAGGLLLRIHNRLAREAAQRQESADGFDALFVGYIKRADVCFMSGDLEAAGSAIALAEETASTPVEAALAKSFRGRLEEWSALRRGGGGVGEVALAGRRVAQAIWREALAIDPNCVSARAQLALSLAADLQYGTETILGVRNPTPEAPERTEAAWKALEPIARDLEKEISMLEASLEQGGSPLPAPISYHQANFRAWTRHSKERLEEWRRGIPVRPDR